MRRLLLGQGVVLIITGVACAVAAPWSSIALIEILAITASAIFQTAGSIILVLVYTDQVCLVVDAEREEPRSEIAMHDRRGKIVAVAHREATGRRALEAAEREQEPTRRALAAHAAPQGAA